MFAFASNAGQADPGDQPKGFDDYEKLVMKGLPEGEQERMREAFYSLRCAEGYFDNYEAARAGRNLVQTTEHWAAPVSGDETKWARNDFPITMPVMQRVIRKLHENLYKRSPTRALRDPKVSAVVDAIYRKNAMGPKYQRADEFTGIGGFSAWQFAGIEDPSTPVRIHLWSADQVAVFTDPYDHETVKAVVTMEKADGRTRATLWTEDKIREYTTRRDQHGQGPRQFVPLGPPRDNPYRRPETSSEAEQGRGIIPFAFNHFDYPATEFTVSSPGDSLRALNEYVNFGFDDLADGVRYLTKPIGLAQGVGPDWEAPPVIRPGMFLNLAAGDTDAGGNGPAPSLSYLQADQGFVAVIWSHLNQYLDLSLEMVGVPPSCVRMVLDNRSGVSILAEQAPLLGWTEQRRRSWAIYEERAISTLLLVLASHLRTHNRDSSRYDDLAINPGLALSWPRLYVDLPGPERNRADSFRVATGQASIIDLVQEQQDCTREQAIATLKRVKADNDELRGLGIEPVPAAILATAGAAQGGNGGGGFGASDDFSDAATNDNGAGISGEPVDANARADSLSQEGG